MSSSDAPDTDAAAASVVRLMKAGSLADALALAERLVAAAPNAANYWQTLSVARIAAGDLLGSYRAAIQALRPAFCNSEWLRRSKSAVPARVTTGTPIQSASQVVIPPVRGSVSSEMSISR